MFIVFFSNFIFFPIVIIIIPVRMIWNKSGSSLKNENNSEAALRTWSIGLHAGRTDAYSVFVAIVCWLCKGCI